jgi:hypothetical protein
MVRTRRKVFHILLILQLTIASFSVAVLHDACFCGEACAHVFGERAVTDHGTHHDRCSYPGCQSCNVEEMVSFDTRTLYDSSDRSDSYEAPQVIVVSAEHFFDNHTLELFSPIHFVEDIAPPPIYLRNLSLLF